MNEKLKIRFISRLHRIEGQVRGVENMVHEGREDFQIIQQLEAIKEAAHKLIVEIIKEKLSDTQNPPGKEDFERILRLLAKS